MNDFETKTEQRFEGKREPNFRNYENANSRKWTGVFILLIGVAALAKNYFLNLPMWLFSWPMILIVIGLFIGIRQNFRGGAWFTLIILGSIFLLDNFFPNIIEKRFLWPLAFIVLGLFLIMRPRRHGRHWKEYAAENDSTAVINLDDHAPTSNEDLIDSTSIFGGIKKNILSKSFKGGEVVNIMGGTEINLSQADIQGRAVLEVTQLFGGTKIIVPAHWDVKPEMAAIFGGIDDKRVFYNVTVDHNKVLVLKGTSVFGGIEIKSF